MAETDYYKILGVSTTATSSEIKSRYMELSKKIHPDHGGDDTLMALVNEAYKTLSDSALKRQYDDRSSTTARSNNSGYTPPTRPASRPRPNYTSYSRPNNQQARTSSGAQTGPSHQPSAEKVSEKGL